MYYILDSTTLLKALFTHLVHDEKRLKEKMASMSDSSLERSVKHTSLLILGAAAKALLNVDMSKKKHIFSSEKEYAMHLLIVDYFAKKKYVTTMQLARKFKAICKQLCIAGPEVDFYLQHLSDDLGLHG